MLIFEYSVTSGESVELLLRQVYNRVSMEKVQLISAELLLCMYAQKKK